MGAILCPLGRDWPIRKEAAVSTCRECSGGIGDPVKGATELVGGHV